MSQLAELVAYGCAYHYRVSPKMLEESIDMPDIACPGCMKKSRLRDEQVGAIIRFECPFCHTRFALTFDTGADDARRAYEMADDTDESDLLI